MPLRRPDDDPEDLTAEVAAATAESTLDDTFAAKTAPAGGDAGAADGVDATGAAPPFPCPAAYAAAQSTSNLE